MELNSEKIEKFGNGEITLAEVMNVTSRQKVALLSLGLHILLAGTAGRCCKNFGRPDYSGWQYVLRICTPGIDLPE